MRLACLMFALLLTAAVTSAQTTAARGARSPVETKAAAAAKATTTALTPLDVLDARARARVGGASRVPLGAVSASLSDTQRLYGPEAPNYLKVLASTRPTLVAPFADVASAFVFEGRLPSALKAAMGLRVAQVTGSPYVAAHARRLVKAGERGDALLAALASGRLASLEPAERSAIAYADALTRSIHGVTPEAFANTRRVFDDGEIVELTMTVSFFNYLARFAEAVRLPVEPWAVGGTAPALPPKRQLAKARVALISDEEMAATAAAVALAQDPEAQKRGLGLGIANSQRAMLRVPALARAWRAYGTAAREQATVGRDIQLQVSLAVSMVNGCRYCTLHQVLGLRRLGVDPGKLLALRKSDEALTPRELLAVKVARQLTAEPTSLTDAQFEELRDGFGDTGAVEVVMQTANFAFMNRFTDGLMLPSEDEAIRVYQEVYGSESQ